jgi:SAM-dependent methyltransferase
MNLFHLLVCPQCKKELDLQKEEVIDNKVKTGKFICTHCNKEYPIINFIPRFVDSELYVESFGDEWNIYKNVKNSRPDMSKDEMKNYLGIEKKDIENKTVLEIGCGAGPYLDISAREYNAKHIIGVDLSRAVDAAYENVGELENVTIVQADLFNLPFKEESFDVVYSLGVLHHTPNTQEAFNSISNYVKPQGVLSVWIYGNYWKRKIDAQQWLRKNLFCRFSPKALKIFSFFSANILYYLYLLPVLGDGLRERFPIAMDQDKAVRELNTFDMYSPTHIHYHYIDELYNWFADNNFKDMTPSRYLLGMKGKKSS